MQLNSCLYFTFNRSVLCSYINSYIECPWTPPTIYYSYTVTLTCVSSCPSPYFAFVANQSCLLQCPTTPNISYYDYTNRKCVSVCPVNTYAASNQSCLNSNNKII